MPREAFQKAAGTHARARLNRHALVQLINRIPTDIDILREQLVRHLVLLQDVVIGPRARERGPEQEAEHPAPAQPVCQPRGPLVQTDSQPHERI